MTIQNFEQITAFGKANFEALAATGAAAAKGSETLVNAYVAWAKQSVSLAQTAVKTLSAVKTPVEFQAAATNLTKSHLEAAQSEGRKLQELATKLVTDSLAPLNARVTALSGLLKAA